jgi:nicotinamide riboside transporter PnuC
MIKYIVELLLEKLYKSGAYLHILFVRGKSCNFFLKSTNLIGISKGLVKKCIYIGIFFKKHLKNTLIFQLYIEGQP